MNGGRDLRGEDSQENPGRSQPVTPGEAGHTSMPSTIPHFAPPSNSAGVGTSSVNTSRIPLSSIPLAELPKLPLGGSLLNIPFPTGHIGQGFPPMIPGIPPLMVGSGGLPPTSPPLPHLPPVTDLKIEFPVPQITLPPRGAAAEPAGPTADGDKGKPNANHHKLVPASLCYDSDNDDDAGAKNTRNAAPSAAPGSSMPGTVLNLVPGPATIAALTGSPLRFPICTTCGFDHLGFDRTMERPIEKLNRHHTFRKNLRVLLAGVPWLREQRGVLDVTDAKCAVRTQACLVARVPGYKERGLSLDRNDFIPKCMAWRLGLRLDQVPAVHRDPHSRSIFYPYFRIYNSQTYAPTPEMAEILGCELPSMKASGGRKKFRTMDIRDWEPNDPASKNALNAWLPFTVPPELFNALIDCKEAIDSRRTAAETLLGAFLGPDKPPSDETDHKKSKSDVCDTAGSTRKGQDKFKALSEVLFGGAADSLIDDTPSQPSVSKRKAAPSDGNGYASEQTTSFKGDQAAPSEEPAGPRAPKRAKPDLELVPVEVALMTDLLGDADDAGDGAEPEDDIETWLPSAETMGLDRKLLKAHEAEDFETEPWPEAVGGMPSVGGGRAEIVSRDGIGFALDALAAVTSM